jgi:hypothetical protein
MPRCDVELREYPAEPRLVGGCLLRERAILVVRPTASAWGDNALLRRLLSRVLMVCIALSSVSVFSIAMMRPAVAACTFVEPPDIPGYWNCPPGENPGPPPRAYKDMYTAIALTKNLHGYGAAFGFSLADAETTALQRCANAGSGCYVRTWARNACTAVAVSLPDGHNTGAWSVTRYAARSQTLADCRKLAGNCKAIEICTP